MRLVEVIKAEHARGREVMTDEGFKLVHHVAFEGAYQRGGRNGLWFTCQGGDEWSYWDWPSPDVECEEEMLLLALAY